MEKLEWRGTGGITAETPRWILQEVMEDLWPVGKELGLAPLMVQGWEDGGYRQEGWVVMEDYWVVLRGDFWGRDTAWLN